MILDGWEREQKKHDQISNVQDHVHLATLLVYTLVEIGVSIAATDLGIPAFARTVAKPLRPICCTAMPYPTFPSDL